MLFPTIDQCMAVVVDTECVSHLLVYVPNIWHRTAWSQSRQFTVYRQLEPELLYQ